MRIIVHPQKGNYKILFLDHQTIRGAAFTELSDTPKGLRPVQFRLRWGSRQQYRNTPTKDLIASLRKDEVFLTGHDTQFERFLSDFQIPFSLVNLCRVCLLEERITPLNARTAVRYRGSESICPDCAKRELRRELAHMGRMGRQSMSHMEELLLKYRDVDRVLASIQPEQIRMSQTLFDRLEAHPVQKTAGIEELPLPRVFVEASGVKTLLPAQQIAVDAGLLYGKDLLVVSATASGKTFIGEMAGIKNLVEGRGQFLFLVPLVALAVQKYQRFSERYGEFADVGIMIGKSRINLPENRPAGDRNTAAPMIVGTYEGIDHLMRCGTNLRHIGTVVIDEVQMLEDSERGHRLDGLIARLKYIAPKAQFLYLSATIGMPNLLAKKLGATLVRYDDRPVSLERYLMFVEHKQKIPTEKKLCEEEFKHTSSKGFHGQTIVFTNSRARCHVIADAMGPRYAAYHAGLTSNERREVETKFLGGRLKGVITTAALGAGVDFPASQVIFDSLAMGISWLTVQEFNQMAGRAGRPDFHDLGKVVILAEPGGTYARGSSYTEEEVAMRLLKGVMEEVAPEHDLEQSSEEYVANAVVCKGNEKDLERIGAVMVGTIEPVLPILLERGLVRRSNGRIELMPLARVMAEHFIGVERLMEILSLAEKYRDPIEILTELEGTESREKVREREKSKKIRR
jgi:helicase